jgi:hypothetical protein
MGGGKFTREGQITKETGLLMTEMNLKRDFVSNISGWDHGSMNFGLVRGHLQDVRSASS